MLCGLFSCQKEEANPPLFELLPSGQTGVSFANNLTETPDFNILEYLYFYNGAGLATADFNNDGLIDLYFVSNQESNKLYLNKGQFQFEDITGRAGVGGRGTWATGVTIADVNGDGFLDIYVSQVGNYKGAKGVNQLFINNGDLSFTESAADYGLDFVGFSTQAAFFDYDRDGDLDMYLLNHSIKTPAVFARAETRTEKDEMAGDRLYQSQLAQGSPTYTDVTEKAGIYSGSLGFGLGLAISDLNDDGWPDIYVSNDFTENDYLYLNNRDGTFTEQLEAQMSYTSRYSMGNIAADLDNDGLNEIITTDMLPADPEIWQKSVVEDKAEVYDIKLSFGYAHQYVRNTLQKNLGNGIFSDLSLLAGMHATDWSWAPLAFDMDNDGLLDLHISNGIFKRPNDLDYVNYARNRAGVRQMDADEREAYQIEHLPKVKIPNYAGRNTGNLVFEPISGAWGLDQPSCSNGSAYADLDNDGDLDLVVNNTNQEAFIYENKQTENKSLKVRLQGIGLNPFGLGATISLRVGETWMTREVMPTRGFQSAVSTEVVFGLGKGTPEEVLVRWPDGNLQQLTQQIPGEGKLMIKYKPSARAAKPAERASADLISVNTFRAYRHRENTRFKDYNEEYLIPRKYSTEGPALAIGDVNNDGLNDLYLGGAKGQAGSLWIQKTEGRFEQQESPSFNMLTLAEDTDALFFDANGDGALDLYVVSAGNEYGNRQVFTFDRLYLNDGAGNLQFAPAALPQFGTHGRKVTAADTDGDSDPDLFVAANIVKGAYGLNPNHHLLINDGRGRFTDATAQQMPDAPNLGMLNDAVWLDYDADGDKDLIVAGEWTALTLLENDGKGLFKKQPVKGFENTEGLWMSLATVDVDADGDLDLVAGNYGLNTKLKASVEQPLSLLVNDFDNNGQTDPVIFHYLKEAQIPFATRDDLIRQMPFIKKKHPNYAAYAKIKSPEDLFDRSKLSASLRKEVCRLSSMVLLNEGGTFSKTPLPIEAQWSPVMDIQAADVNKDGKPDLLLAGNFYGFRNDMGRAAARSLTLLLGTGSGHFKVAETQRLNTGQSRGEYRKLGMIEEGRILAVRNNDHPVFLDY